MDEVSQSCNMASCSAGFVYVTGEVGVSFVQLCAQFKERSILRKRGRGF